MFLKKNNLFLLILSLIFVNALLANNEVKEEELPTLPKEQPIPSASKEEGLGEVLWLSSSEEGSFVKNDTWGFFTDTSANKGISRYLDALQLQGDFRMRFEYFRNAHLKTYVDRLSYGTSSMPRNLDLKGENPDQNNYSANMRFRVDPTINVTESVRIKSRIDIFDNAILGANYFDESADRSIIFPFLANSMHSSSYGSALNVKRLWGEVNTPLGELRFGRVPFHWGLGIVHNSGDEITSDYGDQKDGVLFSSRVFNHYLTPGYFVSYSGPYARGGTNKDESGQRYPLYPSDIAQVFSLSFLKRDSEYLIHRTKHNDPVFDYGVLVSYLNQKNDTQHIRTHTNLATAKFIKRDAHISSGSFWSSFDYQTFHIEAEFAGNWGKYSVADATQDLLAGKKANSDVWLLNGGAAIESRYGFLNDRLQLGFDTGIASFSDGPGLGIREGSNNDPKPGMLDGQKYPNNNGYKTNFRFNPGYRVDMLMYKEVLGAVASTVYFKPHLSYFFSKNFGLRGDVISSIAPNKSNTPGNSNWLGVETDIATFLRSDNGFYFSLNYGVLFPLAGLNHQKEGELTSGEYKTFGTAAVAHSLQGFIGITF